MPPVVPIWRLNSSDRAFEYSDQRAGTKLFGDRGNILQALRFAESADEASALIPGAADEPPLGKNYCPGKHAEGDEKDEHGFGDRTGLKDEINDFAAGKQQEDGRKVHGLRGTLLKIIDQRAGLIGRGYRIGQCTLGHRIQCTKSRKKQPFLLQACAQWNVFQKASEHRLAAFRRSGHDHTV